MTVEEMLAQARLALHRLAPQEAAAAMRAGSVLVDVRTRDQQESDGQIPAAVTIPLNVLEWRADPSCSSHDPRLGGREVPLILLCAQGYCSSLAAARLVALGRDATDVVGGFEAWRRSGLPVQAPPHSGTVTRATPARSAAGAPPSQTGR
jgi:rhodanese-related sulfurtransferase